VTSELFPLLTSPLLTLFGMRGAYVLPALGLFLALAATAKLATVFASPPGPLTLAAVCVLVTPWLFYALEFWEHMPAVGAASLATVWFIGAANADDERSRAAVAGGLYGLSILLRPEAACFFVAVLVSSRLLVAPPRVAAVATASLCALVVVLPLGIYSLMHFGTLIPPHVGSHASLLTSEWLATRAAIVTRWFVPQALHPDQFWGLALLALSVLTAATARSRRDPRLWLGVLALVDIGLVVLAAPNDGGGQWGPRYLLFAFIPAGVIASYWTVTLARKGNIGVIAVVLAAVLGLWVQRDGYRDLRGAKLTYGRVLDFVRREVPEGSFAVTDVWWLDQVAAAATDRRLFLYAGSTDAGQDIMQRLASIGAPRVTFIGSEEISPDAPSWLQSDCYRAEGRNEIAERRLIAVPLVRTCE
jgi:hypothetical protein